MAVDVNRVIVVALLVLMIGCSEKGSEQSSTANKSLSEKQTEAKRDLQIAELKHLEKRAAGGGILQASCRLIVCIQAAFLNSTGCSFRLRSLPTC